MTKPRLTIQDLFLKEKRGLKPYHVCLHNADNKSVAFSIQR